MEILDILFLAVGVGGVMNYLLEKGHIKSLKSALLGASFLIVAVNLQGNPQALLNGNLLNTLFAAIVSSFILGICMIVPCYLISKKVR